MGEFSERLLFGASITFKSFKHHTTLPSYPIQCKAHIRPHPLQSTTAPVRLTFPDITQSDYSVCICDSNPRVSLGTPCCHDLKQEAKRNTGKNPIGVRWVEVN